MARQEAHVCQTEDASVQTSMDSEVLIAGFIHQIKKIYGYV